MSERQPPTIAAALAAAASTLGEAGRMEARLLLRHVTGLSASALVAHDTQPLSDAQIHAFIELVTRRIGGEPIAYLLGVREFYGRDFFVGAEVLIPRPETELLVDLGLARIAALNGANGAPRILDLGCGSGCIAVTLALEAPQTHVTAVDYASAALDVARRNAAQLGAAVRFVHSDWYAALALEGYDLIVSNPPYIPAADPHLAQGDLRFEPATALASGVDGLDAIRRIIDGARGHLNPGGWLLIEHGYDQAEAMHALLLGAGFDPVEQHRDLAGIVRVSGGRLGL